MGNLLCITNKNEFEEQFDAEFNKELQVAGEHKRVSEQEMKHTKNVEHNLMLEIKGDKLDMLNYMKDLDLFEEFQKNNES